MERPVPIRFDEDTWVVMRNSREFPKAIIRRVRDRRGATHYQLYRWDLATDKRLLMGTYRTLNEADEKVLFDIDSRTGLTTTRST